MARADAQPSGGGHVRALNLACSVVALAFLALLFALLAPRAHADTLYVANSESDTVSVIDTETLKVRHAPIPVGLYPLAIAVAPDGRLAYVANSGSSDVSVIDTRTHQTVGEPVALGRLPAGIAITPDGSTALLPSAFTEDVFVIDIRSAPVVGPPIPLDGEGHSIAITPDGTTAFVPMGVVPRLSVIDVPARQLGPIPVPLGTYAADIEIAPDGELAYLANQTEPSIAVMNVRTRQFDSPIPVGDPGVGTGPGDLEISADGRWIYATLRSSVIRVDVATGQVVGAPISVGRSARALALTADGRRIFVSDSEMGRVSVIDTRRWEKVGSPISVGEQPAGLAIAPSPAAPSRVAIFERVARVSGRWAKVGLACGWSRVGRSCRGRVQLAITVRRRARRPGKARTLVLARGSYRRLPVGKRRRVAVRLTKRGRRLVARFHRLRVLARASVSGGKGVRKKVRLQALGGRGR